MPRGLLSSHTPCLISMKMTLNFVSSSRFSFCSKASKSHHGCHFRVHLPLFLRSLSLTTSLPFPLLPLLPPMLLVLFLLETRTSSLKTLIPKQMLLVYCLSVNKNKLSHMVTPSNNLIPKHMHQASVYYCTHITYIFPQFFHSLFKIWPSKSRG